MAEPIAGLNTGQKMSFQRPTLSELIERTFADLTSRLQIPGALLRRSVVGVLSRVLAGASHMLHGHLDYIAREAIPDTAVDNLPRWASIWGIARKDAEFATGNALFESSVAGITVAEGTQLRRADDAEYVTTADAVLGIGTTSVPIVAVVAGAAGNADPGTTLSLVFPIPSVEGSVSVDSAGLTNGSDIEDDDSLRARLLFRIQQPPHGGNRSDYEQWALEVPGVTRAWVYPLHMGAGTVGVTFVRDDDPSIIPDAVEVEAVQEHIDEVRPVTAQVTVFAPIAEPVDYTITVQPNTAAVKAAIEAELRDFHAREAEPGGTLYLSRINEAISVASGEFRHTLIAPASDVVRAAGRIATFGGITWQ